MKQYNKHILEAINRGIRLALDDFNDEDNMAQLSSKQNVVGDTNDVRNVIDLHNNFIDLGLPSGTWWAKYNFGVDPKKI